MLRGCLVLIFLTQFLRPVWADDAQVFAQKVQKFYETTQDATMDFYQDTYVDLLEKEVRKKGDAKFKKPGKFLIRYQGEHGRQYICNGVKLWVFESGDNQVQTLTLGEDTIPAEALSLLGGLGQLSKEFAVEEVDPKKWDALKIKDRNALRWLELTPLKKRSTLDWMVMGFDKDSGLAREVFLYTDSGNLSHYAFDNIKLNVSLSDKDFEYQKGKAKAPSPNNEAM